MRNILTLIFSSFLFYTARANTFIVTSNADSGAGTLREAIGFADQSAIGRTIFVTSPSSAG